MKRAIKLGEVLCASLMFSVALGAQAGARQGGPGRGLGRGAVDEATVTPAEIQRMFDAYALLQAQDQLQVTDEQYPRFLTRFKALQDSRRRALQEHTRMVIELRRLLMEPQSDETQLKDRLQALEDLD